MMCRYEKALGVLLAPYLQPILRQLPISRSETQSWEAPFSLAEAGCWMHCRLVWCDHAGFR